ncbi:MAG TPA: ParB/RepB/Spo0J family partition protein [Acidobacteriota bacterium]|jgi:ParB family chromosome partitioning protein|nr:ParB/RepB/Spo0J family partition protein [Acidobacteriota bacterium]
MKRKALGRGIEALIPAGAPASPPAAPVVQGNLREVDVDLISSNPYQPRADFDPEKLAELIDSIRQNGVLQPVILRPVGSRFELIAGERRWRAAQQAGLLKIPAIIKDVDNEKTLEMALVENLQRADLNPIEEAEAYQQLWQQFGLSQEEIALRVGKSRTAVTNALRLLKLVDKVRKLLIESKLSMGHARALLALEDPKLQIQAAQEVMDRELSVRETERLARQLLEGGKKRPKQPPQTDANVAAAEEKLRLRFGARVTIRKLGKGGRIEIYYADNEDLDRIYELLLGKAQ